MVLHILWSTNIYSKISLENIKIFRNFIRNYKNPKNFPFFWGHFWETLTKYLRGRFPHHIPPQYPPSTCVYSLRYFANKKHQNPLVSIVIFHCCTRGQYVLNPKNLCTKEKRPNCNFENVELDSFYDASQSILFLI